MAGDYWAKIRWAQRNPEKYTADHLVAAMRSRSRKTGCQITDEVACTMNITAWLEDRPYCEACDVKFDYGYQENGNSKPRANAPSIDRIIPELGYVRGNVALLCHACNVAKGSAATPEQLKRLARWLRSTTKGKGFPS